MTSTLDVHARIRDDLLAEREAEEASMAVHLIHAYREGRAPLKGRRNSSFAPLTLRHSVNPRPMGADDVETDE